MTVPEETRQAHRVTVVLSGGEADVEALATLTQMRTDVTSEVVGLFLEDTDLLRIAGVAWSHEVSRLSPKTRPLRVQEIERQMRAQAARARRALQDAAERAGMRWSFRTIRGELAAALQATREGEVVLLSASSRPAATAAELRALSPRARSGFRRAKAIAVAFAESERSARSMTVAARLSRSGGHPLEILVPSNARPTAEAHVDSLDVPRKDFDARIVAVPSLENEDLIRTVRERSAALLIVHADDPVVAGPRLASLRRNAGCPLLVIR